jgi:hypothetical protein
MTPVAHNLHPDAEARIAMLARMVSSWESKGDDREEYKPQATSTASAERAHGEVR